MRDILHSWRTGLSLSGSDGGGGGGEGGAGGMKCVLFETCSACSLSVPNNCFLDACPRKTILIYP